MTFNYDTIIESVIESASGPSDLPEPAAGRVPDDKLSYSSHNWNRALAYGVLFDEVELQQTGTLLEPVPVSGSMGIRAIAYTIRRYSNCTALSIG